MKRKFLLIMALLVALIGVLVVGCVEEPEPAVAGEEVGEYYCDVDGKEYSLILTEACKYTLIMDETTLNGNYVPSGELLLLALSDGELKATYFNDTVTLDHSGSSYKFLRKIDYTVTFETNGGGAVISQSVRNGRTVTRPTDPTKTGEVFVGWYTDSAFKSLYSFTEIVTTNLKLYARFVAPIDPEFTVSFDLMGGEGSLEPIETVGHKLFSLPTPTWTGHTFVGWWVSQYEDGEKLTYQYQEHTLVENITLYAVWEGDAPAVSVEEKHISWTAVGTNSQYRLVIKNLTTGKEEPSATTTQRNYAFDFSEQDAGDYEISVSVNNKTAKAYYKNKGLARVSAFQVEGNTLLFNGVENATKYLLNIVCGNESHKHTEPIELGAADEERKYDFSTCEMLNGAITFTVTAAAEGYLSSTSEPYKMTRTLDKVTGISVDANTATLSWTAVSNAMTYIVTITPENGEAFTEEVSNGTTVELKDLNQGKYEISITPKARGWNSPEAETYTYDKLMLATPDGIRVDNTTSKIVWNSVSGAKGYEIKVGEVTVQVDTNEVVFDGRFYVDGKTEYSVFVRALGDAEANHSLWSETVNVRYGSMGGELRYSNKTVTWDPVFGVNKFVVKVGEVETEWENVNSAKVEFTAKGETKIFVYAVHDNGELSDPLSMTVMVYELSFDAQGGSEVLSLFLAVGDSFTLSEDTTRTGYTFADWYTEEANGDKFTDSIYVDERDRTVYAQWTPNTYHVTFDLGEYGDKSELSDELRNGVDVTYGEGFALPVPESTDLSFGFRGWYTAAGEAGVAYTTYDGVSRNKYTQPDDMKLYAHWVQIFNFVPQKNGYGAIVSYQVSKAMTAQSSGIKVLTIPAEYKGVPVNAVVDFTNLTLVEEIRIPDSIRLISVASSESAFTGCASLKNIKIYETGYNDYKLYSDDDGVLLYHNIITGETQLKYYPIGRTDTTYTVSSKVQTLPAGIFNRTKLVEIVIPANVTLIEAEAIRFITGSTGGLTTVKFLAAENGVEEKPLTLRPGAFTYVTKLTNLQLPARTEEFNFAEVFTEARALKNITVVGTGGAYTAVEGLLCRDLGADGIELAYWPLGRTGEFTLPPGILSIGTGALKGNKDLTKIVIPATLEKIGANAFDGCINVESIVFEGTKESRPLTIEANAFAGCNNDKLTEIVLPENLVKLGTKAFSGTKIQKVTVNSGALGDLDFGAQAFSSVTLLILGPYVKDISFSEVFGSSLVTVDASANNNYTSDAQGVLYNKEMTIIAFYPDAREGKYVLPATVTVLPANVFSGKKNMTEIELHESLTEIGDSAFSQSGLTGITIPNSVKTIGSSAFSATPLATVTFAPGNATNELTIRKLAFESCIKLTTVSFPERLIHLGAQMFQSCSSLEEVHLPATLEAIDKFESTSTVYAYFLGMFGSQNSSCKNMRKVTVAEGNKNYGSSESGDFYVKKLNEVTGTYYLAELLYHPANGGTTVVIEDTTERIWRQAFDEYNSPTNSVTSLTFKNNKAKNMIIETQAFNQMKKLTKLVLPEGTRTVRYQAVYTCQTITEIVISSTVEIIESRAFSSLTKLTKFTFEEGDGTVPLRLEDCESSTTGTVVTQSNYGFYYSCASVKEVVLPERTTYIGDGAFRALTALTSVTIPSTVERIGVNAFYGCTGLTTVNFVLKGKDGTPSKLTSIENEAFSGCTKIAQDLVLPASLQTIGFDAFYKCTALKSLTFEDNSQLQSLGVNGKRGPFYDCTGIKTVNFGKNSSLTHIYDQTFSGSSATAVAQFTTISIPASVELIGKSAFYNSRINSIVFETVDGKSSLKRVEQSAFGNNANLTAFTFPETDGIITVGMTVFTSCSKLATVHLSSGISSIEGLFSGANNITTVTISESNNYLYTSDGDQPIIYSKQDHSFFFVVGMLKGELVIDEQVVKIGAAALKNQTGITKIVIPTSVEEIGNEAFYGCTGLVTVEFKTGSALKKLGSQVFNGCSKLESINFEVTTNLSELASNSNTMFTKCTSLKRLDLSKTKLTQFPGVGSTTATNACTALTELLLPDTLETLTGSMAFANTKIAKLDLSNTKITSIGTNSFTNCKLLTEVKFPKTLTSLGQTAFYSCTMLTELDFSNTTLTSIGNGTSASTGAFTGCTNLKKVIFPTSLETIGNYSFYGVTKLEEVNVGSVQTFGTNVFNGCTSLSKVDLSGAVSIGSAAFQNCGFTELTIPAGVTSWGSSAFNGNKKLTKVVFPATLNASTTFGANMFQDCSVLDTIVFEENCAITDISASCFINCTSLTSISNWPSSIKTFGNYAFQGCTKLTSVDFTSTSVESFGNYVFNNCTVLEEVKLPDTVTTFGTYAFQNCKALESIKLPKALTALPASCFNGCSALATIEGLENILSFGASSLSGTALTSVKLNANAAYTTSGTGKNIKGTFSGCTTLKTIDFGDMTAIPDGLFWGCTGIEEITLPNTITSIGACVFTGCTSLKIVNLGMFVESFGNYVFADCSELQYINLESLLVIESLPQYMFSGCTKLAGVGLPLSLKSLGAYCFQKTGLVSVDLSMFPFETIPNYVFDSCASLESVVLPNSLTSIGNYVFQNCVLLEQVTLPENVKTLGTYVFNGCSALTTINLGKVEDIGERAFQNCVNLATVDISSLVKASNYAFSNTGFTSFTIPAKVERIGSNFFYGCTKLETVTFLGEDILAYIGTSVPNNIFQNCSALTKVDLPSKLTAIGTNWFTNCTALTSLEIPESVTSIGANAFDGCGVTSLVIPKGVNVIGNSAFKGSSIRSITFLNGNFNTTVTGTTKPTYLFQNCKNLTEVKLPEGLNALGNYWFSGATALTTVELPTTLTTAFTSYTFNNAKIETLVLREGTTSIAASYDTYLKAGSFASLKNIVIPKSVRTIDAKAFANLTAAQNICFVGTEAEVKAALGEDAYNAFRAGTKAVVSFEYKAPTTPAATEVALVNKEN